MFTISDLAKELKGSHHWACGNGTMIIEFAGGRPVMIALEAESRHPASLAPPGFLEWLDQFCELGADDQWATLRPAGSPFQKQVWKSLLRIPSGETTTYGGLAAAIGRPSAARAVGRAVGSNQLAVLIPCHRVVKSDGGVGGFRWGQERKIHLLEREARAGFRLTDLFSCKRALSPNPVLTLPAA